jgi:hypothetical protein
MLLFHTHCDYFNSSGNAFVLLQGQTMHFFTPEHVVRLGWNGWHYTAFKANANRAVYLLYSFCACLKQRKE